MALIKCPECGKEVSAKATACPVCGCPIAAMNPCGEVAIKICNGLAGTVRVINMTTSETLWQGKAGQIARFEVTDETHIGVAWGLGAKPQAAHQAHVKAKERYELAWQQGFFSKSIVLNRVDVIDS